ncbi:hypothetical protein QF034_000231 [Streptomyces africanus]|uniref:ABC transporter permease n=1 Tax=Streptomyces africanus TaxID=231024 RepID=A0ABU0QF31_9ACTN|nr:hypothetical protein [Streptomyces africanus]
MANFPYRIGRWAFRRRRPVSGLWLGALMLAVLAMSGTDSQKVFELLEERR